MNDIKNKKIMLSGGGTGGSVTPLLAVASKYLEMNPKVEFVFVGTKKGPEKKMVRQWGGDMRFISMTSGKLRRYASLANILDIFKITWAFFQSFIILSKERPSIIISAGSFVSVPLVWAAGIMKVPVLIHQQDVRPGLANKLMAKIAKTITVTFEESIQDYGKKAVWIGNPIKEIGQRDGSEIRKRYNLERNKDIVLIIGGGTGAVGINKLVASGVDSILENRQVVHLTGKNKDNSVDRQGYHSFSFLPHKEVIDLITIADVVVSRCGLGVLTELSLLRKASILIPIPKSHQEDNANLFKDYKAALVLNQLDLTGKSLALYLNKVLGDKELLFKLKNNISKPIKRGASEKMIEIIENIIK